MTLQVASFIQKKHALCNVISIWFIMTPVKHDKVWSPNLAFGNYIRNLILRNSEPLSKIQMSAAESLLQHYSKQTRSKQVKYYGPQTPSFRLRIGREDLVFTQVIFSHKYAVPSVPSSSSWQRTLHPEELSDTQFCQIATSMPPKLY